MQFKKHVNWGVGAQHQYTWGGLELEGWTPAEAKWAEKWLLVTKNLIWFLATSDYMKLVHQDGDYGTLYGLKAL